MWHVSNHVHDHGKGTSLAVLLWKRRFHITLTLTLRLHLEIQLLFDIISLTLIWSKSYIFCNFCDDYFFPFTSQFN